MQAGLTNGVDGVYRRLRSLYDLWTNLLTFHAGLTNGVDGVEERVSTLQGEDLERGNGSGTRLSGDTTSETGHCP